MTPAVKDLHGLCSVLAQSVVAHPSELAVRVEDIASGVLLVLHTPHRGDYGKLLGVHGGNLRALRTLVTAASARRGLSTRLLLDSLPPGAHSKPDHFQSCADWDIQDNEDLAALVRDVCVLITGGRSVVHHRNISRNATTLSVDGEIAVDESLMEALEVIVRAIGMNRGRVVFIDA
jgi:predicted RNA-binding protein YlqC (UPF0109 family)